MAPLHGSMGVLIRPGSDFIACNLLENRPPSSSSLLMLLVVIEMP